MSKDTLKGGKGAGRGERDAGEHIYYFQFRLLTDNAPQSYIHAIVRLFIRADANHILDKAS